MHGIDPAEVVAEGSQTSRREIQRAKNQFRYIISTEAGVREAARLVGCAPASIVYAKGVHAKKYNHDFYYTELMNETLKRL